MRDQPGSATGGGSSATGAVDLNRANQSQLEELPGVGPVTAQAILTWRQQHGRFSRIEELQEVDGIGPTTYAQIAPHVRSVKARLRRLMGGRRAAASGD